MKKKSFNLIISIILLITAVATVVTGVFAWMSEGVGEGNSFTFITGNVDLSANLYFGNDINKDGILEPSSNDYFQIVTPTRGEKITYLYTEASRNTKTGFYECAPGTSISYKIVIYNDIENYTNAKVAINFANLSDYFFDGIDDYLASINYVAPSDYSGTLSLTPERISLLGSHSARIGFFVNGLTVRRYHIANNERGSDFTTGYNNLIGSSIASEVAEGVTLIENLNQLSISSSSVGYNLWNLSAEEQFVQNITVEKGDLLEIDFKLSSLQIREVVDSYPTFAAEKYIDTAKSMVSAYAEANSIILTEELITQIAGDYIEAMCNAELTYLYEDDGNELKEMKFSISKIYITGTQIA